MHPFRIQGGVHVGFFLHALYTEKETNIADFGDGN